jgi:superfamily I DNA/RNA helicase
VRVPPAKDAGLSLKVLDANVETAIGKISIGTMHLAKAFEFRAVAVMACDDEVIPLQQRIETVADDADPEDVYNTGRQLLFVACTRPREYLLVSSVTRAFLKIGSERSNVTRSVFRPRQVPRPKTLLPKA